eukprot:1159136-Pelagomonas_calceolata.AAC.5
MHGMPAALQHARPDFAVQLVCPSCNLQHSRPGFAVQMIRSDELGEDDFQENNLATCCMLDCCVAHNGIA